MLSSRSTIARSNEIEISNSFRLRFPIRIIIEKGKGSKGKLKTARNWPRYRSSANWFRSIQKRNLGIASVSRIDEKIPQNRGSPKSLDVRFHRLGLFRPSLAAVSRFIFRDDPSLFSATRENSRIVDTPINRTIHCRPFPFVSSSSCRSKNDVAREQGGEAPRHAGILEERGIGWLVVTRAVRRANEFQWG